MSVDPFELEAEAAQEEYDAEVGEQYLRDFGHELLYPEHYEQAIGEFKSERLRSYYVANPFVCKSASEALEYSRGLLKVHPRAALVFADSAIELLFDSVLLTPLIFGLVHTDGVAELVSDLVRRRRGAGGFERLLTELLRRFGGVDLKMFKRSGSSTLLLREADCVHKARNDLVHGGTAPGEEVADLGIAVATALLEDLFPRVLRELQLHVHDDGRICATAHGTEYSVSFAVDPSRYVKAIISIANFNLKNPPAIVEASIISNLDEADLILLCGHRSLMFLTSLPICYLVEIQRKSMRLSGNLQAWSG